MPCSVNSVRYALSGSAKESASRRTTAEGAPAFQAQTRSGLPAGRAAPAGAKAWRCSVLIRAPRASPSALAASADITAQTLTPTVKPTIASTAAPAARRARRNIVAEPSAVRDQSGIAARPASDPSRATMRSTTSPASAAASRLASMAARDAIRTVTARPAPASPGWTAKP